jgi:hypothetical protein
VAETKTTEHFGNFGFAFARVEMVPTAAQTGSVWSCADPGRGLIAVKSGKTR